MKQINIRIDDELFKKFRVKLAKDEISATGFIVKKLEEYTKCQKK